jgi:hypothetical protein
MDRKTCTDFLDTVAPGWKNSDRPAQFVKTIDPKHRQEAARALHWLSQNPKKTKTKNAKKAG